MYTLHSPPLCNTNMPSPSNEERRWHGGVIVACKSHLTPDLSLYFILQHEAWDPRGVGHFSWRPSEGLFTSYSVVQKLFRDNMTFPMSGQWWSFPGVTCLLLGNKRTTCVQISIACPSVTQQWEMEGSLSLNPK